MRLPLSLAGCTSVDMSAVVAMPARAAVAVLIRSLSTLLGVTHHSPVVAVLSPDRHGHVRRLRGGNTMLAEMVDHVVGIDPDRDWITAAVLEVRRDATW